MGQLLSPGSSVFRRSVGDATQPRRGGRTLVVMAPRHLVASAGAIAVLAASALGGLALPAQASTRQPAAIYSQFPLWQTKNFSSLCSPYGSGQRTTTNAPIVAAVLATGANGCWAVGSDGGVFSYGNATFYGSMAGKHLDAPVVGMASDPATGGYWLVAADGGVFTFGKAPFYGSMGGTHLDAPVVGMALDQATGGYWLTASDGGVFSFDAPFYGSTGGRGTLPVPVAAILATSSGTRYFQLLSDPAVEPGVAGRSGYDLARVAWVNDSKLDCASQTLPLFQGAQYLLIGEHVDGGTTSGYATASNELYQESTRPGMVETPTQQAEYQRDTAALNSFFHSDVPGTCG